MMTATTRTARTEPNPASGPHGEPSAWIEGLLVGGGLLLLLLTQYWHLVAH